MQAPILNRIVRPTQDGQTESNKLCYRAKDSFTFSLDSIYSSRINRRKSKGYHERVRCRQWMTIPYRQPTMSGIEKEKERILRGASETSIQCSRICCDGVMEWISCRKGIPTFLSFSLLEEGPYVVERVYDGGAYQLIDCEGRHPLPPINGRYLKTYYSWEEAFWCFPKEVASPSDITNRLWPRPLIPSGVVYTNLPSTRINCSTSLLHEVKLQAPRLCLWRNASSPF